MKQFLLFLTIGFLLGGCWSKKGCTDPIACNYDSQVKKDDGSCDYSCFSGCPGGNCPYDKTGTIFADETWTSSNIYIITGKVVVASGVTLTIEPGTIIKGNEGTGALASAIVVSQGGQINAQGTASSPIIFTSILDNIQIGELTGTNLEETDRGLWGGVIICGNAPISAADGDVISQVEGIPATDTYGAYGGSNPSDNSGTLKFISIRHGGALLGAGNEINGLTLAGVGSATEVSDIEIIANKDDGLEIFGGTVNASNIIVGFVGDDALDVDMNYTGTVEDFLLKTDDISDEAIEADGAEGVTNLGGLFTIKNGTILSSTGENHSQFKSRAKGTISNVDFNGSVDIAADYSADCLTLEGNCLKYLLDATPTLIFNSCDRTTLTFLSSCTVPTADANAAEAEITPTSTPGNTNTNLSWTWMHVNGKL